MYLSSYQRTSSYIWLQTTESVYEIVPECFSTGSIHNIICTNTSDEPVCDEGLNPVYSATGMVCKSTCEFNEYNLSTNKFVCKSADCPEIKIVLSVSKYSCLVNLNELSLYQ